MKAKIILILTILNVQLAIAQKLTLSDLENICTKKNWESANQFLMNKNWEYFDSSKGDSDEYSTITWSFNKGYGDKASAWFYVYSFEAKPEKITYSVFNKPSYTIIQNSLRSKGYTLKNSEIEDKEIVSTYVNSRFILKISTEKREKDEDIFGNESVTAYRFNLIKKSSVYDPDNGKKIDYYSGGSKQAEYTKVNGKISGVIKVFYENGQLKKTGTYKDGKENGKFIEYNEKGQKVNEYNVLNDKLNGKSTEYYYNEKTDKLNLKSFGNYLNGEKTGTWKFIYVKDEQERVLTIENYNNGIKNGFAQEVQGDSLILANYSNNKLSGSYKVFVDVSRTLFGGVIETDTTKVFKISDGFYTEGKKSGYWKNYSLTRTLKSEGYFLNDLRTGEWKYYYSKYEDNNKPLPYSEKLYSIENFKNGKLDGVSKRFSYLNKEKYPCSEKDEKGKPKDTCTRLVYQKVFETATYTGGKLNGVYELRDSLKTVIKKGVYEDDFKDGEWLESFTDETIDGKPYRAFLKGSYSYGDEEGKWVMYYNQDEIKKTFNYSNGKLDGEFIEWNNIGKPSTIKQFDYGKLTKVVVNDSLGNKPKREYDIFDETSDKYSCRYTQYLSDAIISQVYWVKKEKEINHAWFDLFFRLKLNKDDQTLLFKDGDFNLYTLNKKPLISGKYYFDDKTGKWTYYYYDQDLKIEQQYSNNKVKNEKYFGLDGFVFSGEFTYLDSEKKIKEIRKIKNGLREGKTEFVNLETGKVIKKEKYKEGVLKQ